MTATASSASPSRREPGTATWLVIGASGFLGNAVAGWLERSGRPWVGASRGGLPGRLRRLDLLDGAGLRRILGEVRPRFVVDAAGHPPGASAEEMRRIHLLGSGNLLAAVAASPQDCRVLLVGTAAEYGNSAAGAGADEDSPLRPLSAYGRIKALASEGALRARARGVDLVVARVFNTIGPGQGAHLLAGAMLAGLQRGEQPLRVRDANFVRDWTDVRDVARALVLVAETAAAPPVVNVCSGTGRRVAEVAQQLAGLAGAAVELEERAASAAILWHSVGQPQRLAALGFAPAIPFARGLADQWRAAGSPGARR